MQLLILILLLFLYFFFVFFNNQKLQNFYNIYDYPNHRKIHKEKVSLIGGAYIYFFFIFYFLSFLAIFNLKFFLDIYLFFTIKDFLFFFIILSAFFVIGLLDDKFSVSPFRRVFLYFILIYIYVSQSELSVINNIYIDNAIFIKFFSTSKIFTALLILGIIISMNLYDGMNGQSALFFIINFFIISIFLESKLFGLIIFFPSLLFLYFNLKNKAFLGESGVNILSFFSIVLVIKIYNLKIIHDFNFSLLILIFLLPLCDSIRLLIFRLFKYGNPFRADKNHLHHRLLKKFGNNWTLFILNFPTAFIYLGIYFKLNSLLLIFLGVAYYLFVFLNSKFS